MSSNKLRKVHPEKPEQEPDLSAQYGEIGIKAVAAATHHEDERSGDASGKQEPRKRATEKANG